eukprot:scaffold59111_cov21-Tisochrysis_lutea.AAC.1
MLVQLHSDRWSRMLPASIFDAPHSLTLLQLDPELWSRMLPAMVRILGPPSSSSVDGLHMDADEASSVKREACGVQLLWAAQSMAPQMHHTQ